MDKRPDIHFHDGGIDFEIKGPNVVITLDGRKHGYCVTRSAARLSVERLRRMLNEADRRDRNKVVSWEH